MAGKTFALDDAAHVQADASDSSSSGGSGRPGSSDSTESSILEMPKQLNPGWHLTIVTAAFTTANVFSPFTLATAGWSWGSLLWIYSYATTWWSGIILGECAILATKKGAGCSYPEMMREAFGFCGYWFAAVMQVATYYLVNVSLVVNFGDWMLLLQRVAEEKESTISPGLCLWQYVLIGGALAGVLAQVPTFKKVIPFAIVSLVCTCIRQGVLYYQIGSMDLYETCSPEFGGVTPKSSFISLATTAFLFGGHGLIPEEIRELRRPESFFPAMHWAYAIIGSIYLSFAYVAYLAWGRWIVADVQLNYPLNTATLISALASAVWGLVETLMSHVMMFSLIEQQVGLTQARCPRVMRFLLRSGTVATEVFLALMFSSAGLGNIQGVIAAFGFTALTYYCPFLAYWKLFLYPQGAPFAEQALYLIMCLSGMILTVVGIYASTDGMAQEISQYQLFDTSVCSIAGVNNISSCSNPCLSAYGFDASRCELLP